MQHIEIKKNLIIFRRPEAWYKIREQMIQDVGRINIIISWRCKREFGFTVRDHRGLEPHGKDFLDLVGDDWKYRYHYQDQIHLDFYSEAQMTWFQLKYLNI